MPHRLRRRIAGRQGGKPRTTGISPNEGGSRMRKILLLLAATALTLSVGSGMAQDKKTLAVVVKGLDNGFFTVMGKGCADWNTEHPDSEYECLYTGPALTSD